MRCANERERTVGQKQIDVNVSCVCPELTVNFVQVLVDPGGD